MGAPAHDTHHEIAAHATKDALHHGEHVAGHAEHAAHAAHHEPHELLNIFHALSNAYPDNKVFYFLHSWENVIFSVGAATLISILGFRAASKKSLVPKGIQNVFEVITQFLDSFVCGILGERGREHVPFVGTLFLYILFMNWSGLIPLMKSPTAAWSTTLALALATLCYIQYIGIRDNGIINYIKHLSGNPPSIYWIGIGILFFVINLCVEFIVVPMSLSLRLFANISSEDRLLYKFADLTVSLNWGIILLQFFVNVLAIVFSFIQAFVFMLLTTVYLSLVMPHDDHEDHEEHPVENTKIKTT